MAKQAKRREGEYCSNECKNRSCTVNYRNAPKGVQIASAALCGSQYCKGYQRP